ncbi:MAG: hypothetical protein ABI465_11865, partial [Ktedonobacteraceae bacterium]
SEDGVAELLEVAGYPFVIGIQGHPEELYTSEPVCAKLFSAFVTACSKHTQEMAKAGEEVTVRV